MEVPPWVRHSSPHWPPRAVSLGLTCSPLPRRSRRAICDPALPPPPLTSPQLPAEWGGRTLRAQALRIPHYPLRTLHPPRPFRPIPRLRPCHKLCGLPPRLRQGRPVRTRAGAGMYCVPLDAPCLRYLQVPGPGMYYAPSAVSAQKDSSKHSYASWGFGTSTRADQVPWPILTGLYLLRNQLPKTLPTWMIRANQDL